MCQALEELMEEREIKGEVKGEARGEIKGVQKQQIFTIRQMLDGKFDIKDICRMVGCDATLVEEVQKNLLP